MPMSGLPEDAIERFFEKSSEKRERFQKFWKYTRCGRFFQKSGTVFRIFGNIPDKAWTLSDFLEIYLIWKKLKKVGAISDFLHMYYDDNRRNAWKRVSTKKITIFSVAVGKNWRIRERNWVDAKKIEIFSKIVRLKRLVRERNWVEWIFFGFLQKWWW